MTSNMAVSEKTAPVETVREPLLSPVDRVSEFIFGLLMALSFVGAVSVAETGDEEIRTLFVTALGCNLAWGIVDAVMYLVRTVTDRGRLLTVVQSVVSAPDAKAGREVIERSLSRAAGALLSPPEVEAIRGRIVALPNVPARPALTWNDVLAAVAIFLLVVISTFPVVVPFMLMEDVAVAKSVSRAVALVMLFVGGLSLGRYAGYGSWRVGLMMAGLGTALVAAIHALGG